MKDKREENAENEAFEKIMDENFPNLIKILNSQSNSMNPKQEKLEEKHAKTHNNQIAEMINSINAKNEWLSSISDGTLHKP